MNQPPPMKFWEATSAFREFTPVLAEVFGSERWRATHAENFFRTDELVHTQDRAALDSLLPIELTREIARRCDGLQFYFCAAIGLLRRARPGRPADAGAITLTALDVHDRFGGSVIEVILEYGSATVGGRAP
jgi:hypothetical protein